MMLNRPEMGILLDRGGIRSLNLVAAPRLRVTPHPWRAKTDVLAGSYYRIGRRRLRTRGPSTGERAEDAKNHVFLWLQQLSKKATLSLPKGRAKARPRATTGAAFRCAESGL